MTGILTAAMPPDELLGLYGDHQPSLLETSAAPACTGYALRSAKRENNLSPDWTIKDLPGSLLVLQIATT